MRLLERWFTEHGGAQPRHVVPYRIAFRATLTTTFPPSEIEQALSFDDAGEDLTDKATRRGAMMALRRRLSKDFGIPIQIEQFIGHKYRVPLEKKSSTVIGNIALGSTAMLGEHIWTRHARIRLILIADRYHARS